MLNLCICHSLKTELKDKPSNWTSDAAQELVAAEVVYYVQDTSTLKSGCVLTADVHKHAAGLLCGKTKRSRFNLLAFLNGACLGRF